MAECMGAGGGTNEVAAGAEPGARGGTLFLIDTNSFEDLTHSLDDSFAEDQQRARITSGTISQIAREGSAEDAVPLDIQDVHETVEDALTDLAIDSDPVFDESERPEKPVTDPREDVNTEEWKQQKKHIFVLSSAGKPVYSRYGNEDKLVTLMGVMQAIVSFVQHGENNDSLRSIIAGDHKYVFFVREHLILVAAACSHESTHQLYYQLTYVYNQILSILTYTQLSKIFKQRRNYDLRRLLTGAEKFIDSLLNLMDHDPSILLGSVRCLPLNSTIRDTIAQSIVQNAKVKDLVFAILMANNQLITMVKMKKYSLHPADLHLIFNLVTASESFKSAESWTPICLPKFDNSGYLYGHVSYLDVKCQTCMLLLTVDREAFFTLSDCKQKIVQRLSRYNCLQAISESLAKGCYSISQVDIPDLRHFMYKSKSTAQFTSPELEAPYGTKEEQERLYGLYLYVHNRIHSPSRPLKILFHVGDYETLLGWVTSGFELYAVFGPLVTKPVAINSINKLLKWIKKEEDRLFILNAPTF